MPSYLAAVLALVFIFISGCAHAPEEPSRRSATETEINSTRVEIRPDGNAFRARFDFPSDAAVWGFHRSALRREDRKPWRPDSWAVLTPGVELVRIGEHDALVASDGGVVPRTIDIQFEPAAVDLIADYDPALVFTDGTVALFSGVFSAFPFDSRETLANASGPFDSPGTRVTMINPGGSVFHAGRYTDRATFEADGYGIYGDVAVDPSAPVARIFDPQLPGWLGDSLDRDTPAIFRYYEQRLGDHGGAKPLIIASYVKSDVKGVSQGGSTLPGMITMRFEGDQLSRPDAAVFASTRWFIAHEAAHFWLGEAIRYDGRDRAWITEGGADIMAVRATEKLDPAFSASEFVDRATTDCTAAVRESGVEAARRRNEQRPYYACGLLFALAVERAGASRGEDYFDFLRTLIDAQEDREVNDEEWLAAAAKFGVGADKIALIRRLLTQASTEPETDLKQLLSG